MPEDEQRRAPSADVASIERFAAALKESERRDREAKAAQRAASAKRDELADARRELERVIAAVRSARGAEATAAANAAWKAAKVRVIELETGAAPSWAPAASSGTDDTATDASVETLDDGGGVDGSVTTDTGGE